MLLSNFVSGFSPRTYFTADTDAQKSLFEGFKRSFNKTYAAGDEPDRFRAFVENLQRIDANNAEDTAEHGITK